MIFNLLIVHNHDRMSSTTRRVLYTTTWDYFTSDLPGYFIRSPIEVQEAIMADINDLVQEFWRTSSDGTVGVSFFEIRLLEILQKCFNVQVSHVCFVIISVFGTAVDLIADKFLQSQRLANSWSYYPTGKSDPGLDNLDRIRAELKILFDGYRKMFDQSFSNSKDLGDMFRLLPGVVVQKHLSLQGMVDLYRIKPDLLERLIKSTIEPLKRSSCSRCILDDYLSRLLQDRDRSRLYYCDPMLQHISICRHFLSLLDGSNALDLQS